MNEVRKQIMNKKDDMATITNTMDRVIMNSKKQNMILQILVKSLLTGLGVYAIFILTLVGSFHFLSSVFQLGSNEVGNTVLIVSSVGYLALYSLFLIKEMRSNNFCK